MRNYVQNTTAAGLSHDQAIRRKLMLVILGLAASTQPMLLVNALGYKEVNYIPFFLGLLLLLGKGTKPVVWSTAILTGSAWNLVQLENPLRGGAKGLIWWTTTGLPAVIVFWLALTGFLATWSFEQSPESFYPIVAFGILIFFALTAWGKWEGDWMFQIVLWYSAAIIVIALAKTTFLGDWIDRTTREEVPTEQVYVAPATYVPPVQQTPIMEKKVPGCTGNFARFANELNCHKVYLVAGDTINWLVDGSVDRRVRCVKYFPNFDLEFNAPGNGIVQYTNDSNVAVEVAMYEVPLGKKDATGTMCTM